MSILEVIHFQLSLKVPSRKPTLRESKSIGCCAVLGLALDLSLSFFNFYFFHPDL